ncbi:MAG: hypothetical protein LBD46_07900 [Endomicrobium sp.]|jgi:hypothetical protein|nr:hypothetical protein [Endomicrobium sp.]
MADKIEFHFKGGNADKQQLPVEYMINLLSNVKDLAYLMIAQYQGITFNERFRPSKEIKEQCFINCELPKDGSYNQAISIGYREDILLPVFNVKESLDNFFTFSAKNDEKEIERVFPHPKMRIKALSHVRSAFPPSDDAIYVEINNIPEISSKSIQKNITTIIDKTITVVEEYMTVVTGRLVSIDFEEHKIVITHPMTKRLLDCFYNEDVEDMLLENRRDLVQITGQVILDENDQPKKITDVISIQEVDLSPIEIDHIECNGIKLKPKRQLILTPKLDETEQLYLIENPSIGLELFAYTRQELYNDIKLDICYLWEEYAKVDDDILSEDAKKLKTNLLDAFKEI